MEIANNIIALKRTIPDYVKLVAVSKFKPESSILEAYSAGQRVFGESRAQELEQKFRNLPKDIEWHMIGHLQTNKVKTIVPFVHTIQSVDSFKLLETIDKEASKIGRIVNCLLEIHIAKEEEKFGFNFEEVSELIDSANFKQLKNVKICGLMGMATYTDDQSQIISEFSYLKNCFDQLKSRYLDEEPQFTELSMGMSGDYPLAIAAGSNVIRIGTSIFGNR